MLPPLNSEQYQGAAESGRAPQRFAVRLSVAPRTVRQGVLAYRPLFLPTIPDVQFLTQGEAESGGGQYFRSMIVMLQPSKEGETPAHNLLIMLAIYPAPKPLSMFTTATPAEQLLSMARSAARP